MSFAVFCTVDIFHYSLLITTISSCLLCLFLLLLLLYYCTHLLEQNIYCLYVCVSHYEYIYTPKEPVTCPFVSFCNKFSKHTHNIHIYYYFRYSCQNLINIIKFCTLFNIVTFHMHYFFFFFVCYVVFALQNKSYSYMN